MRCTLSRFLELAVLLAATYLASAQAQPVGGPFTRFEIDAFSLEHPASWSYKLEKAPDGSSLHMFKGPQEQNALPYCHATQNRLSATLNREMVNMNAEQRRHFFLTSSNQELLFSLYDNLPSAQGFRLIHINASVLGGMPAFQADFTFRVPQGFIYRVRSHYTFWSKGQLSVWCQTVSRADRTADDVFHRNLAAFQRVVASVKIVQ